MQVFSRISLVCSATRRKRSEAGSVIVKFSDTRSQKPASISRFAGISAKFRSGNPAMRVMLAAPNSRGHRRVRRSIKSRALNPHRFPWWRLLDPTRWPSSPRRKLIPLCVNICASGGKKQPSRVAWLPSSSCTTRRSTNFAASGRARSANYAKFRDSASARPSSTDSKSSMSCNVFKAALERPRSRPKLEFERRGSGAKSGEPLLDRAHREACDKAIDEQVIKQRDRKTRDQARSHERPPEVDVTTHQKYRNPHTHHLLRLGRNKRERVNEFLRYQCEREDHDGQYS